MRAAGAGAAALCTCVTDPARCAAGQRYACSRAVRRGQGDRTHDGGGGGGGADSVLVEPVPRPPGEDV